MAKQTSTGEKVFTVFNYIFVTLTAFICLLPLINVLSVSFSSSPAAAAGMVKLWPVDFTLSSYEWVMKKQEFWRSFFVSIRRIGLGYVVNMVMMVLVAYPLSRDTSAFGSRNRYAWFFVATMMFNGGLIPTYMVVRYMGLTDKLWALVLPNAVSVFNVILLMNFFRELPKELEEAAYMDGAGHWTSLVKIYLPLSKPALATVSLFILVGHWNGWFDGLIYMNSPSHYPLQSYLRSVLVTDEMAMLTPAEMLLNINEISDRTLKAAQVFLAALPILCVYPFLQRYFMKGLVMGSVKG